MAITVTNCSNGKYLSGSAVSSLDIFDGEGYCNTFAKTIGLVDFRLFARAHSYDADANTISVSMYLFGRKNISAATWDAENNSVVTFTFGEKTATSTRSTSSCSSSNPNLPGSSGKCCLLGYATVESVPLTTGTAKSCKAVWSGMPGTSDCDRTYTISQTMDWSVGDSALAFSSIGTTSFTATLSGYPTERACYTSRRWEIKNNTTSGDYSISSTSAVNYNSTTTSWTWDFTERLAGNNYTVRFSCMLRNYNGLTETGTVKAPIWRLTKSLTLDKATGKVTLGSKTATLTYGGSSWTTSISTHGGALSYGTDDTSIATTSISSGTVTITPKKAGKTFVEITSAATTNYKEASATINITVNKANGILTLSASSKTLTYGGSTTTVTINSAHSMSSISSSSSNESIFTRSRNIDGDGKTITLYPKGAGSATLTVTCAATTNYKAVSKTVTVTVNRANITVPTGATRTYNGSKQSCTDSSISGMTLGGTTEATNGGSYSFTATPDSNHKWSSDGTTTAKTISWKINPKTGKLTLGSTTCNTKNGFPWTTSMSTHGGTLSYATDNTDIALTSISDGMVTITPQGEIGSTEVNITCAGTTNYKEANATINITIRPAEVRVGSIIAPIYIGSTPVRRIYVGSTLID